MQQLQQVPTSLSCRDLDGVPVAEEGNGEVERAFAVSLAEELLHDALAPHTRDSPRTARVADIGTLDGNLTEGKGGKGEA